MKKLLLILVLLSAYLQTNAQQRTVLTQYMYDMFVFNPAYAGSDNIGSVTLHHRDQWVNFDGAPTTQMLNAHTGLAKDLVGVGLKIEYDEIGVHSDLAVYAAYAYKLRLPNGTLSMGLQAGFNNLVSNYGKTSPLDPMDPLINNRNVSFRPNAGVGFLYKIKDFYLGFSVPYMLRNKILDVEDSPNESKEQRYYFLNGGKNFHLAGNVIFKPSFLVRLQENQAATLNLSGSFVFYDRVALGANWRSGDSVSGLFQLTIVDNLHIGYSYDFVTSNLSVDSGGSHEFLVNFKFRLRDVHKNIECPSFFSYE
ncbi:PorP/SprF family type IX secretion system membrane protein [Marinigracilibium pacificum]|uniref:Type IX secretion system membrane protein PorP/SprF n=1 Tax=Marinigracilibium pacificum TaxID=2729599 RepID=A0A848IYT5_9BACT|nr:type IX secretion system membrane protein PorP/SprF [Marinigracilibium pacificum]NMM48435.1 type IX secretion system membrane protein PorP/SprF [Marinigracilibium pacificum]